MKLLIVESPTKAKTVTKFLGTKSPYHVTASVGHIRDLPKSNKTAIDIPGGFVPRYVIPDKKKEVVEELQKLAKKAEEIILATDPDREGEAIAWHIADTLAEHVGTLPPLKRVVFHEITKTAIDDAMAHPREIDQNLRRAQEARRVLDRLVGYDLSGLIWKKVRYGLSAGRVQSPALRILVEREREIRAFVPETFWVIEAHMVTKNKEAMTLTCATEPRDRTEVDRILAAGKQGPWSITDVKATEAKRSPKAPFITSSLQQTASSRLGFTPSRTMRAAQKLYEAGHITYMRTDSTTLSAEALQQIAGVITKEYGAENLNQRQYKTQSKNAQEAHEAIRPTNSAKKSAGSADDQKRLYALIRQRTIASQMIDAKILKTKISATVTGKSIPDFAVTGSHVLTPGWLLADPEARGEDVDLPRAQAGDPLTLQKIVDIEKQTQPPARYSEAGLIRELEKRGIGRPSTYASIIQTILDRGYITKDRSRLQPTDTGEVVSEFLEKYFAKYISDSFTAELEDELDDIANGKREYESTLKTFYTPFHADVEAKENIEKITNLGNADAKHECPKCKSPMIIKLGKNGKFLSCSRFPECDGALLINGDELKGPQIIGKHPDTDEPIYLLDGRFGPYVQIGERTKANPKPKRASVPADKDLTTVTLADALHYLSLPRNLGTHPTTGKEILANKGRFGPYIVHDGDFRSLKKDDVFSIELPRALEILAEEKKSRRRKSK
ncbi:MAG: type I DNA topoisomerase [Candidatus Kerfeldbacteria bacterium]|nr:type I DNA topoisomerase [Candidatus Kerfeldbacteria bacterium]